jgi:hypothetical protein
VLRTPGSGFRRRSAPRVTCLARPRSHGVRVLRLVHQRLAALHERRLLARARARARARAACAAWGGAAARPEAEVGLYDCGRALLGSALPRRSRVWVVAFWVAVLLVLVPAHLVEFRCVRLVTRL